MEFPIYQVPILGNGMTIALDAVLHVVISHGVAIGVISLIVLGEYLGIRRQSAAWDTFAADLLKATLIIVTGVGAVTGVGIWFTTSALEPRGIGSLLRIFFWPWFTEWFAFTGEVIVLLIYFFTWASWTGERKRQHLQVGVAYCLFGLASAFLITGILGFMLTPDDWPWDRSFWLAFFNPTFLPQLLLRLAGAYALGAIFTIAFLVLTRREPAFRRQAVPLFGRIALGATLGTAVCSWWYFAVVPSRFTTEALFSVLTSALSQHPEAFWIANGIGLGLVLLFGAAAIWGATWTVRVLVLPVILLGIAFVGEFERVREFIRGPYIMPGYMYANQVLLAEHPLYSRDGLLPNSFWYNATVTRRDLASAGVYLFGQNCSVCHTIGGINDIGERVRGRSEDGLAAILAHTHEMVPFMPPFSGTAEERRLLGRYLFRLGNRTLPATAASRFVAEP
jgi:mono/diheme cytochrome c family protein